uniref:Uncharacterized protein n=1 Tax=Entomoneis paludosa TaxID=265537 RepID=A0A7S2Y8H0_9STRA
MSIPASPNRGSSSPRKSNRLKTFLQSSFHKRNNHSHRSGASCTSSVASAASTHRMNNNSGPQRRSSWSLRKSFSSRSTEGGDEGGRRSSWSALLKSAAAAAAQSDRENREDCEKGATATSPQRNNRQRSWSILRNSTFRPADLSSSSSKSSGFPPVEEPDDEKPVPVTRRSACSSVSSTSVSTATASLSDLLSSQVPPHRGSNTWADVTNFVGSDGSVASFQAAIEEAARSDAAYMAQQQEEEEEAAAAADLDEEESSLGDASSTAATEELKDSTTTATVSETVSTASSSALTYRSIIKSSGASAYSSYSSSSGGRTRLRSNIHPAGDIKRINFFLDSNEYHESGRTMSEEEWSSCWYTPNELSQFKKTQAEAVKRLFKKKKSNNNLQKRPSFSRRLKQFKNSNGSDNASTSSSQVSGGSTTNRSMNSANTETVMSNYGDWRDILFAAYQECRKVKRGDMDTLTGKIDREQLKEMYQEYSDLVGLEVYVLFALRGSVSKQVNRILDYWDDSWQRSHVLGADGSQQVFCKTCRSLTQPAAVLVQEIAMAQAAALHEEG